MSETRAATLPETIAAHLRAAMAWGLVTCMVGLIVNALLLWPALQDGHAWLSYGRVRAVHTNVPLFGWFWPVYLASLLYGAREWFGLTLWRPGLARVGLWLWNGVLALGVVLLLTGHQQAREYSELPLLVDVLLAACAYLPALCVAVPLLRGEHRAGWLGGFALGVLVWFPLLYVLGNPPFSTPFDSQAVGYQGQNILGYSIGGFIIAGTFLALHPAARAAMRRRSRVLWLAAVPPVAFAVGVGWDVAAGRVPHGVQALVLATSVCFLAPLGVMAAALVRAPGRGMDRVARLAFVLATALYVLTNLEGCAQFASRVRGLAQFTAWMPGHAHLAMGAAIMLYVFGAAAFLLDRTQVVAPSAVRRGLAVVLVWAAALGGMAAVLTVAGWFEGRALVVEGRHVLDVWSAERTVWLTTFGLGLVALLAQMEAVAIVWAARPRVAAADAPLLRPLAGLPGWGGEVARRSRAALALTTLFFMVVVLNLFAGPSDAEPRAAGAAHPMRWRRGKALYVDEGCVACHTMHVRPLDDARRYGPPSTLAEYQRDVPHQLGTRRIGPDLLREGGKHSDLWQEAHLVDPRALAPGSPMPSYAYLAPEDREALVAYLQSLGPAPGTEAHGGAAAARRTAGWPMYAKRCAVCHGEDGNGLGAAAKQLGFRAGDFTNRRAMGGRRDADLVHVIRNGIPGTRMPAWPQLTDGQVAQLLDTLRAFAAGAGG